MDKFLTIHAYNAILDALCALDQVQINVTVVGLIPHHFLVPITIFLTKPLFAVQFVLLDNMQ